MAQYSLIVQNCGQKHHSFYLISWPAEHDPVYQYSSVWFWGKLYSSLKLVNTIKDLFDPRDLYLNPLPLPFFILFNKLFLPPTLPLSCSLHRFTLSLLTTRFSCSSSPALFTLLSSSPTLSCPAGSQLPPSHCLPLCSSSPALFLSHSFLLFLSQLSNQSFHCIVVHLFLTINTWKRTQ